MTPLPPVQYIVQYDFGDDPRCAGWGYVGECITSLDDAAEEIIDKLGQGYAPDVRRWSAELIGRDVFGHSLCASSYTSGVWSRAMRLIAERTPDPADLPHWHPDYEAPTEYAPRSLAEIVGGGI